eukprot:g3002.t1
MLNPWNESNPELSVQLNRGWVNFGDLATWQGVATAYGEKLLPHAEIWSPLDLDANAVPVSYEQAVGDAGIYDDVGHIPLLRRKVMKMAIFTSEAIHMDLCQMTYVLAAFGQPGCLDPPNPPGASNPKMEAGTLTVFEPSEFPTFWSQVQSALQRNESAVIRGRYTVVDNEYLAIKGGWKVDIVWVIIFPSKTFRQSLPKETQTMLPSYFPNDFAAEMTSRLEMTVASQYGSWLQRSVTKEIEEMLRSSDPTEKLGIGCVVNLCADKIQWARDAQIDVPVPMPNPKPSTDPQPEAAGASEEAEPKSFPKRAPKPGSITFNMQGAQKALAAARTRVQVQSAVEAAKAKRLNVKDAATQTVRDPERQDGDIVTIWRLRPRGMESFPHFAKPKARRTRFAEILAKEGGAIDPHDPSERTGTEGTPAQEEVTIDLEGREHGGDDAELSGGEAAVADPYQTTFEEVDAVVVRPDMEAVGNIILSLHRNLQEIQSSLASGTFDAGLWGGRGAWLAERNGDVADSTVLRISSVGETEVPFSANGTLQKPALARLAKAAEEEAPEAVSIHVRLSFAQPGSAGAAEPLEVQRVLQPKGPPPGGRAASSWALTGGRYPRPLFDSAATSAGPTPSAECVLGWAKFSFDLATESRSALRPRDGGPKRLKMGPLRERILQIAGRGDTPAAEAELNRLLHPPKAAPKAAPQPFMEADLQVIPIDDAAKRLLPFDFPAVTEALRMGGLEVLEDASGLQIDADLNPNVVDPDTFVRGLLVTLPEPQWMENFLRSVPSGVTAAPGNPHRFRFFRLKRSDVPPPKPSGSDRDPPFGRAVPTWFVQVRHLRWTTDLVPKWTREDESG